MKVKAVDIAKRLNLSKATVSLALNEKPGVSEETRDAVFRCRRELELEQEARRNTEGADTLELSRNRSGQTIKVIMVSRGMKIVRESEMDLWTEVLAVFDREAKADGYSLGITYMDMHGDELSNVIAECNSSLIAGVILYATEMKPEDIERFRQIQKPMIVYDNDLGSDYHSVLIDNRGAGAAAAQYLLNRGCRSIQYLAQNLDIYNFEERREGFLSVLEKRKSGVQTENVMIRIGTTIRTVEENFQRWIRHNPLPDGFVLENYQISLGVMKVLREAGIEVPGQVSLVGIDQLPDYVMWGYRLTSIRISHSERAAAVMAILKQEIQSELPVKFKVLSRCEMLEGDSVRR